MTLDQLKSLPPAAPTASTGSKMTLDQLKALPPVGGSPDESSTQPTTQGGGFFRSLAQGITKPFAKLAVTGTKAVGGLLGLGMQGAGKAIGSKSTEAVGSELAQNAVSKNPVSFGGFLGGSVGSVAPIQSTKEAIGTGLELGSYAVGGEGAGGAVEDVASQSVKGLVKSGAKIGATAGALQGAGTGIEKSSGSKESAGKQALNIAADTAVGAAGGAIAGGITGLVGGVAAKATGAFQKTEEQALKEAADITSETLDKTGRIKAFKAAGQPGGVNTEGNVFDKIPSKNDVSIAESVRGIVSTDKTPPQNVEAINKEIGSVAGKVGTVLEDNPGTFESRQLNNYLKSNKPSNPLVNASPAAKNAYNGVREAFLNFFNEVGDDGERIYPGTNAGLWKARSNFDNWLEQNKSIFGGDQSALGGLKTASLDTRQWVNDFISENLPEEVRSAYQPELTKMSNMYRAIDRIATKNQGLFGKNYIIAGIQSALKKPYISIPASIGIGTAAEGALSRLLGAAQGK